MKKGNTYTSKTKGNFTKIYINGILHLSIPSTSQISIQSWVMSVDWYVIEIQYDEKTLLCEYDDFEKWKSILNLIDNCIK